MPCVSENSRQRFHLERFRGVRVYVNGLIRPCSEDLCHIVLSRPNLMECDRLSLQAEVTTAHGIVLLWTKFEDICTCPFLSSPNRDISTVSALAPNPAYVSQLNFQTQFISHTKKMLSYPFSVSSSLFSCLDFVQ